MPDVNIPATGRIGTPPPPGADLTPSQPLQANAGAIVEYARDPETGTVLRDGAGNPFPTGRVFTPAQQARENERELAPLKAPGTAGTGVQAATGIVERPKEVVAAGPAPPQGGHVRPVDLTRPAASAEEDPVNAGPSRGIPGTAYSAHRNPKLPQLELGAGFGAGAGEYFALTGLEVAEAIRGMMDSIAQQLDTDLRFSIAATYPRYSITLNIRVEAEAGDQTFEITTMRADGKIPEEVAEQMCEQVVFVVKRQKREFNETDDVETPPDALRQELGLVVPQRQVVSTGKFGPLMADVPLGF